MKFSLECKYRDDKHTAFVVLDTVGQPCGFITVETLYLHEFLDGWAGGFSNPPRNGGLESPPSKSPPSKFTNTFNMNTLTRIARSTIVSNTWVFTLSAPPFEPGR